MDKPTVYLDTNIISAFYYEGRDFAGLARRNLTRDWWTYERSSFVVWASAVTEDELFAGVCQRKSRLTRCTWRFALLIESTTC